MKHSIAAVLAVTAAAAAAAPALAANGGCPAGQEGKTPFTAPTASKGHVDTHIYAQMPLGEQAIKAPGWRFRSRAIAVGPGAVIAVHSHNERPETVTMKQGELKIYETNCKVGYAMKEGEVFQSGHGKEHWAANETDHTAIMYVVDLVKEDTFPGGAPKPASAK